MLRRQAIIVSIFILCCFVVSCMPGNDQSKQQKTIMARITARSGLNMRSKPALKAPVLAVIPHGGRVPVLGETGEPFPVEGKQGRWTKVVFNGKQGWVFGGYLRIVSRPQLGRADQSSSPGQDKQAGKRDNNAPRDDYLIVPGKGVGPIRLGKPVPRYAMDIFGRPDKFELSDRQDEGVCLWQGKLLVKLNDGTSKEHVFQVFVYSPLFHAEKGIKIGSSLRDLRMAYPEGKREQNVAEADFGWRVPGLVFFISDEKVGSIGVVPLTVQQ